ncbi:hypothetical protein A2U01_0084524, partial [Trifolium medium]|nr:hypothetical protein [Trifolium medium]
MIKEDKLHVDLQELNSVILQCFHDETVEFPFVFCLKATLPSIKKLVVRHSAFKEIFPSQTSDI